MDVAANADGDEREKQEKDYVQSRHVSQMLRLSSPEFKEILARRCTKNLDSKPGFQDTATEWTVVQRIANL